jgi:formamidopyrimidine-DNA glycosylase
MPELPEVETVRMGLEPALVGRVINRVILNRADLRFPFPDRFIERLTGARVSSLERRAKYLVAHLSTEEALVMHLGMTGRFHVQDRGDNRPHLLGDYEYDYPSEAAGDGKHAHAVFELRGGGRVIYSDPRRFGYMLLIPEIELLDHPALRGLGVEPLSQDLTAAYLAERAAGRRTDLKAFLMDQRNVAGLGNIYVLEALHAAGLKPSRSVSTLATRTGKPTPRAERLAETIRQVLTAAVAAGGSTLRDYRQADGSTGSFQKTFRIYGRSGEPCLTPGCRGTVRRIIQGGRSSFFCPVCQH